MASSGWQNEQKVVDRSPGYYNGNIRIDLISHSGTNLRVKGAIAFCPRGGVSTYAYYYEDVTVTPRGGSAKTIVPKNQKIDKDKYVDFDVTLTGISATSTSTSFTVVFYNKSYFNKTLSWTLNFDQSGSAPTGGSIAFVSNTWNSVTATSSITNWGGISGDFQGIVVTGSTNGAVANIDSSNWTSNGRTVTQKSSSGTSDLSSTVLISSTNYTHKYDNPIDLIGLTHYKLAYWNANSIGNTHGIENTIRYLPPAPSILEVSASSDGYDISFTGDTNNNNSVYDTASLKRTVRYKIDNGDWVYIENNTQRVLDYVTTGTVPGNYAFQIVIQGWMTYHDLDSEISEYIIEPPGRDYKAMGQGIGKFDNSAVRFDKIYIAQSSVTKKLDKLYISVRGKARRIF